MEGVHGQIEYRNVFEYELIPKTGVIDVIIILLDGCLIYPPPDVKLESGSHGLTYRVKESAHPEMPRAIRP